MQAGKKLSVTWAVQARGFLVSWLTQRTHWAKHLPPVNFKMTTIIPVSFWKCFLIFFLVQLNIGLFRKKELWILKHFYVKNIAMTHVDSLDFFFSFVLVRTVMECKICKQLALAENYNSWQMKHARNFTFPSLWTRVCRPDPKLGAL